MQGCFMGIWILEKNEQVGGTMMVGGDNGDSDLGF